MTVRSKTRTPRDPLVRKMSIICVLGFGGFILWAGLAPLEEGVAAVGKIIVENDRQQVQHFEGGIIEQLLVREGSLVEAGDTLVVLKSTASRSNRNQVIQQYAAKSATIDRLEALNENLPQLSFSDLDDLELDPAERASIIKRETTSFEQEGIALSSDIAVLNARVNTAQQLQRSRSDEIEIGKRALTSARSEREVVAAMVAEQLARRDRLTEVDRLVASLEGDVSRLEGERADALANERDLRAQIGQARARTAQRWATEILQASSDLQVAREQLEAAQDVVERSVITAPVSGEVLNLKASTIGGVIRPGDTLMELVPVLFDITASVQIMPADRPTVYEGLLVRTQLSSYKGWQAPRLDGEIIGISADLKTDPVTGVSYYEARVRIPKDQLARIDNANILPGMPVDTFIYSGRSRTLIEYVLEPFSDSLFRGAGLSCLSASFVLGGPNVAGAQTEGVDFDLSQLPQTQACISLGLAFDLVSVRDPRVLLSMARELDFDARVTEAKALSRPRVSAFGRSGFGDTGLVDSAVSSQAGLQLSQRVFDFGNARFARRSARANADASRFETSAEILGAGRRVANAYLTYLESKEKSEQTRDRQDYFTQQLGSLDRLMEMGGATLTERATVAAEISDAEAFALDLTFQMESALIEFELATGASQAPCNKTFQLADTIPSTFLSDDQILLENPNIQALRGQAEALDADTMRQKRSRLPIISVVATGSYASVRDFDQFEYQDRIGVDISVPLYEGNGLRAATQRANARAQQAESEVLIAERDLRRELQITRSHIKILRSQSRIRQEAKSQNAILLEAAEDERTGGTMTFRQLTEIRLDYEASVLEEISTRFDLIR